jgi:hypothetical protein
MMKSQKLNKVYGHQKDDTNANKEQRSAIMLLMDKNQLQLLLHVKANKKE